MAERVRRAGYLRPRELPEPVAFDMGGYRFETDGKDLWAAGPDTAWIDRVKVTRYVSSRSMAQGYPRELVRPEPMTADFAHAAAAFWLEWSTTADAARHRPVHLDHYVRTQEAQLAAIG